jgi:hypothetical protein
VKPALRVRVRGGGGARHDRRRAAVGAGDTAEVAARKLPHWARLVVGGEPGDAQWAIYACSVACKRAAFAEQVAAGPRAGPGARGQIVSLMDDTQIRSSAVIGRASRCHAARPRQYPPTPQPAMLLRDSAPNAVPGARTRRSLHAPAPRAAAHAPATVNCAYCGTLPLLVLSSGPVTHLYSSSLSLNVCS